jgi:hypothetical protein
MAGDAAEATAGPGAPRWLPSIRTAVRLCLAAQVVVAGAIVTEHLWDMRLRLAQGGIERVPTEPVSPGDQTRPTRPPRFRRTGRGGRSTGRWRCRRRCPSG